MIYKDYEEEKKDIAVGKALVILNISFLLFHFWSIAKFWG